MSRPQLRITRRQAIRLAALATTGLLAACGGWPRPPTDVRRRASRPPSELAELVLGLPGEPVLEQMPLLHLLERGALDSTGSTIRLALGAARGEPLAGLLAGRLQLAWLDITTALRAAERGVDIVGIFQLYAADASVVFGLDRVSPRRTVDLAGLRLGLSSSRGSLDGVLTATLRSAGLTPGDLELVPSETESSRMLESGRVAGLAGPAHLLAWFEARGEPLVRYPAPGWEIVPGPVLATSRALVSAQRGTLVAFTAALQVGLRELLGDPAELRQPAIELLARSQTDRNAIEAQVNSMLVSWRQYEPERGPGWMTTERVNGAGALLARLGLTQGTVDPGQVFVNDLLPQPSSA